MSYDPVVWTIVIACKIIILLAILFCCSQRRRKQRNLAYQQTIVTNNVTAYPQLVAPPCNYATPPSNFQTQPGVHNGNVYQPQSYNVRPPADLPPSYSEIFNPAK